MRERIYNYDYLYMGLHYVECAPLMYAIIVLAFILHVMRGCLSFCFLLFAFFSNIVLLLLQKCEHLCTCAR